MINRIRCSVYAAISMIMAVLLFCAKGFAQEEAAASGPLFSTELDTARKLIDMIIEFSVKYSFQALGGILVIIIGWLIAKSAAKFLTRLLTNKKLDLPVVKFIVSIVKMMIIGLAVLIALGKFGITIAPFIAGISVIGFGTSFALQGPLSNYASGLTLIFTKPFKVGDIIEVAGVMGEVQDMTLARTQISTVDGTMIVVPNKHIVGEVIHNFSDRKKLDINVGVSYESDVEKAIGIVKNVAVSDPRIAKVPEPKVGISEFADSSINIYARIWCKQLDYWTVMFDINKKIWDEFKAKGVTIPFPQRDVHIYQAEK